jgi:hypothetical protein
VLRIAQAHMISDCKTLVSRSHLRRADLSGRQNDKKGWCMLCALKKLALGEHWATRKAYAPKEVHNHLARE